MDKEYNLSDYSDFDNLNYFRWKALIRSNEYKEFYKASGIESLIEEKEDLEDEIFERESDEEYEELLSQQGSIEQTEDEIIVEAEERFGLILVSDLSDLKPIDKSIDKLIVSFKDYLPSMPEGRIRSMHEDFTLQEVTYKNGDCFINGKKELLQPLLNGGHKLFLVNPDRPIGFIIEVLKKQLQSKKEILPRKEYLSWYESFIVYDIHQHVRNQLKVKDHLLQTAKLMEDKTSGSQSQAYWVFTDDRKQALKDRVNSKIAIAEKLINLAGQGKFTTL